MLSCPAIPPRPAEEPSGSVLQVLIPISGCCAHSYLRVRGQDGMNSRLLFWQREGECALIKDHVVDATDGFAVGQCVQPL
eukprot:1614663-Amphidinium_carterae.1